MVWSWNIMLLKTWNAERRRVNSSFFDQIVAEVSEVEHTLKRHFLWHGLLSVFLVSFVFNLVLKQPKYRAEGFTTYLLLFCYGLLMVVCNERFSLPTSIALNLEEHKTVAH